MASTNNPTLSIFLWALLYLNYVYTAFASNSHITHCAAKGQTDALSPDTIDLNCSPKAESAADITAAIRTNATLHCVNDAVNASDVHRLKFKDCEFDTIPHQLLANYAHLQYIDLFNSKLRTLREGDIPVLRASDDGATIVDLSSGGLAHIESGTFRQQAAVTRLFLGGNRLRNISTGTFAGLNRLEILNLAASDIGRMAEHAFHPLNHLSKLVLAKNRLTAVDGTWFDANNRLAQLEMEENNITELRRSDFAQLTHLKQLHLSKNAISTIANGAFEALSNLRQLYLDRNRLQRIGDWFNTDNQLDLLDLSGNNISELHRSSFVQFQALTYLSLNANGIVEISGGTFEPLGSLTRLDLSQNQIQRVDGTWLSSENQLKELILSFNNIGRLSHDDFVRLGALRSLSLTHVHLTFIEDGTFVPLRRLQSLHLSENRLTTFDATKLFHSTANQLRTLYLRSNNLTEFVMDASKLARLFTFNIRDNQLNCSDVKALDAALQRARVFYRETDGRACNV